MNISDNILKIHDLIDIVIIILDARDPYTYSHSMRVAELSVMIAENMNLQKECIDKIHVAAHLHDIGKIGVCDRILNKTGRLEYDEILQMQSHSRIGYNILNKLSLFKEISDIVLHHHERYDGLGYPDELKGEQISLESRIIAVADSFDAITSDRPYRRSLSYRKGFAEINHHCGDQFCPLAVKHFNNISPNIPKKLKKEINANIKHMAFVGHEELLHSRKLI